jgi:hypothetical protein
LQGNLHAEAQAFFLGLANDESLKGREVMRQPLKP